MKKHRNFGGGKRKSHSGIGSTDTYRPKKGANVKELLSHRLFHKYGTDSSGLVSEKLLRFSCLTLMIQNYARFNFFYQ